MKKQVSKLLNLTLLLSLYLSQGCRTTNLHYNKATDNPNKGLSSSDNLRSIVKSFFSKTEDIHFIGNIKILHQYPIDSRILEITPTQNNLKKVTFSQVTIANLISVDTLQGRKLSCIYESRPIFSPIDVHQLLVRGRFFEKVTDVSEALALILPSKAVEKYNQAIDGSFCLNDFRQNQNEFLAFIQTVLNQNTRIAIPKKTCRTHQNCLEMGNIIPNGFGFCEKKSTNYGICSTRSRSSHCIPKSLMFTPHLPTNADLKLPKAYCL